MAQQLANLTSVLENMGLTPGLAQWVKDPAFAVSCPELWGRAAATAAVRPIAWELPYAVGAALKKRQKKKVKKVSTEKNIQIVVVLA